MRKAKNIGDERELCFNWKNECEFIVLRRRGKDEEKKFFEGTFEE